MTTSPSDPARVDRAFRNAIDAARGDKSMGAGQRATAVHGLEIERREHRWGVALYPAEPLSQVIAALQDDYTFHTFLLSLWQPQDHPFADQRLTQLGEARALINDYLDTLYPYEVPGVYTEATDADQLERLLVTPVPEATGRIDYKALKDRIDIVDYISRHVQLRQSGQRFTAKCPFHDDDSPSFVVYPATKSYYCFGCQRGGDVIDFAKAMSDQLPAA